MVSDIQKYKFKMETSTTFKNFSVPANPHCSRKIPIIEDKSENKENIMLGDVTPMHGLYQPSFKSPRKNKRRLIQWDSEEAKVKMQFDQASQLEDPSSQLEGASAYFDL